MQDNKSYATDNQKARLDQLNVSGWSLRAHPNSDPTLLGPGRHLVTRTNLFYIGARPPLSHQLPFKLAD